jgi:lysophospholipase L1-like esterase
MKLGIFNYLALGDSYTIGESVDAEDNFPNKTVSLLNKDKSLFSPAQIVAKTGWTTDELSKAISVAVNNGEIRKPYDFVSLLIGVNNQYRGRSVQEYRPEFEDLLEIAIDFAGGNPGHVIVLSIPDWGVTPYAEGRDRNLVAAEIDEYNKVNKELALKHKVNYLDITPWTREAAKNPSLLAPDGLHPSKLEYVRWAEKIYDFITARLK